MLESSATLRMAARQWQTAFWSLYHTKHCMVPSASRYNDRNWRRMWAKFRPSSCALGTAVRDAPLAELPVQLHKDLCPLGLLPDTVDIAGLLIKAGAMLHCKGKMTLRQRPYCDKCISAFQQNLHERASLPVLCRLLEVSPRVPGIGIRCS